MSDELEAKFKGKRVLLKNDKTRKHVYFVIGCNPAKFPGQASYLLMVPDAFAGDFDTWEQNAIWQRVEDVELLMPLVLPERPTQAQIDAANEAGALVTTRNPHIPESYNVKLIEFTAHTAERAEEIAEMIKEMCLEHDAFNKLADLRAAGWRVATHYDWIDHRDCAHVYWELKNNWLSLGQDARNDAEALQDLWKRIERLSIPWGNYQPRHGDSVWMYRCDATPLMVRLHIDDSGYTCHFMDKDRPIPEESTAGAVFEFVRRAEQENK